MKPRVRLRADGSVAPSEPPTEREREMLARLEESGVLRWTEVLQVDIPTLDRLAEKGLARRVEAPGEWEYWASLGHPM